MGKGKLRGDGDTQRNKPQLHDPQDSQVNPLGVMRTQGVVLTVRLEEDAPCLKQCGLE